MRARADALLVIIADCIMNNAELIIHDDADHRWQELHCSMARAALLVHQTTKYASRRGKSMLDYTMGGFTFNTLNGKLCGWTFSVDRSFL